MDEYKVLSELNYAARKWNLGEIISMPKARAAKLLAANQIEPVKKAKESN